MTCQCGMSKLLEWHERGQNCLKPKTGEREDMFPLSKNSEHIWFCALCAPMVFDPYHTWKNSNCEIQNGWFPIRASYALLPENYVFTRQITPLKSVGFWQKLNLVINAIPYHTRWSRVFFCWSDHATNKISHSSQHLMVNPSCHDNRVIPYHGQPVTRRDYTMYDAYSAQLLHAVAAPEQSFTRRRRFCG